MGYLEEWSLMDRDHSVSLLGAIEALKASTLRFPVIEKAVVDILDLKHIFGCCARYGIFHILSLISKVDEMNSVMAEMMHITAQETVLLKQCEGFLSVAAAMYVKIVAD
ncbi:LOW QUALITY PROTEIN: hypothetical protein HID58_052907 [Brassica napus]|uniref:Uncharacterized protein n=1 Tax=Brassica napus TaxID=3708 RepID=A0ABQ8ADD7_BRANA|nr:LOW QUALITY PROTEIN: hypothetical protein HID58_052907 [Brassica napus]